MNEFKSIIKHDLQKKLQINKNYVLVAFGLFLVLIGCITPQEKSLNIETDKTVKSMLHEDIIKELDKSAELFNILILKTYLAIQLFGIIRKLDRKVSEYGLLWII